MLEHMIWCLRCHPHSSLPSLASTIPKVLQYLCNPPPPPPPPPPQRRTHRKQMPTPTIHPRRTPAAASTSALRATEPHIYTAILASIFITTFPSLVSDPASTLLWTLPGLALLQAIYQVRCLRMLNLTSPSGAGKKEVMGVSSKIIVPPPVIPHHHHHHCHRRIYSCDTNFTSHRF